MRPNKFVVFEGCDGAGKTTARDLVSAFLEERQIPCMTVGQHSWLEPRSTRIIVDLREQRRTYHPDTISEAYFIDKKLHVENTIIPALQIANVLSDRYIFSDAVYHEVLYGIPAEETLQRHHDSGIRLPDFLVWIRVGVDEAVKRIKKRGRPRRHYERPADLVQVVGVYERLFLIERPNWLPKPIVITNDAPEDLERKVCTELLPRIVA